MDELTQLDHLVPDPEAVAEPQIDPVGRSCGAFAHFTSATRPLGRAIRVSREDAIPARALRVLAAHLHRGWRQCFLTLLCCF